MADIKRFQLDTTLSLATFLGLCDLLSLPRWLAPLSMVGVLSALIKLLPSMQKGSLLAGIGSYLLLGVLIVNVLALAVFLYLPFNVVTFKTPSTAQAGIVLHKLLLMGFLVILKNLVFFSMQCLFSLIVLVITALTYPPRQSAGQLSPQFV